MWSVYTTSTAHRLLFICVERLHYISCASSIVYRCGCGTLTLHQLRIVNCLSVWNVYTTSAAHRQLFICVERLHYISCAPSIVYLCGAFTLHQLRTVYCLSVWGVNTTSSAHRLLFICVERLHYISCATFTFIRCISSTIHQLLLFISCAVFKLQQLRIIFCSYAAQYLHHSSPAECLHTIIYNVFTACST